MNILQRIFTRLTNSSNFFKSVSLLAGGTLFAQIINVVTLPILTRLYSPSDFSTLAVFNSLLMTISVVSCLRFEIAIPIAHDDKEANNLIILSLFSNFIISLIICFLIFFFEKKLLRILHIEDAKLVIWLLPLGVLFLGIYNVLQYEAIRIQSFKEISKTKISQALSGTSIQLILGIANFTILGLVIGQIIKYSAGSLTLLKLRKKNLSNLLNNFNLNSIRETLISNSNYPKFASLEALANTAGIQLPILIISSKIGGTNAGYLMLAMQVMAIPVMLLGNAISQVYIAHAYDKLRKKQLRNYTHECILKIIKVGVLPLILICLISPFLFPLIFGEEWQRAGEMVLWMSPWYVMQLLVSPISISLYAINQQKIALLLQILGLIIRLGGTYFMSLICINYLFQYYVLSGFIFYTLYLLVVLNRIRQF